MLASMPTKASGYRQNTHWGPPLSDIYPQASFVTPYCQVVIATFLEVCKFVTCIPLRTNMSHYQAKCAELLSPYAGELNYITIRPSEEPPSSDVFGWNKIFFGNFSAFKKKKKPADKKQSLLPKETRKSSSPILTVEKNVFGLCLRSAVFMFLSLSPC